MPSPKALRQLAMRLVRTYGRAVRKPVDEHLRLDEAYREAAGQWVAVDRRTGTVVAVRSNPYELSAYIRQQGIRGVDILRAPASDEPEMVSFG